MCWNKGCPVLCQTFCAVSSYLKIHFPRDQVTMIKCLNVTCDIVRYWWGRHTAMYLNTDIKVIKSRTNVILSLWTLYFLISATWPSLHSLYWHYLDNIDCEAGANNQNCRDRHGRDTGRDQAFPFPVNVGKNQKFPVEVFIVNIFLHLKRCHLY